MTFMLGGSFAWSANPSPQITAEPNGLRWDLTEAFQFSWKSVEVSAIAHNPGPDNQPDDNVSPRTIAVSVKADFNPLKADGLVIVDVNGPQIFEVIDGDGRAVEFQNAQSDAVRCYQDSSWHWDEEGHAGTETLKKPFPVKFRLAEDPQQQAPSMISLLQAYVYAVYADDLITVDVPFDPNSGWRDAAEAPDLAVLVDPLTPPPPAPIEYVSIWPNTSPAFPPSSDPRIVHYRPKTALPTYTYTTWVKSKTGQIMLGLRDPRYPSSVYAFGDYAIVRTELFDSRRKQAAVCKDQRVNGTALFGRYGAMCWGQRIKSDNGNAYDTIRHIIAVHPVEVKIPFVLRNIPVPTL